MHCSTPPIKLPSNRATGPSRPWITKELLSSIKEKHKKYRIYLKHKSDNNWRQFTTIRNNVTTLLRNAKSVFVQSTSTNTQRNTLPHLPSHQSGFRQHDGTELQLARLVHQISAARDSGESVLACLIST